MRGVSDGHVLSFKERLYCMCRSMFVVSVLYHHRSRNFILFKKEAVACLLLGCFLLRYLCAIFALVNRQHCHSSLLLTARLMLNPVIAGHWQYRIVSLKLYSRIPVAFNVGIHLHLKASELRKWILGEQAKTRCVHVQITCLSKQSPSVFNQMAGQLAIWPKCRCKRKRKDDRVIIFICLFKVEWTCTR